MVLGYSFKSSLFKTLRADRALEQSLASILPGWLSFDPFLARRLRHTHMEELLVERVHTGAVLHQRRRRGRAASRAPLLISMRRNGGSALLLHKHLAFALTLQTLQRLRRLGIAPQPQSGPHEVCRCQRMQVRAVMSCSLRATRQARPH